MRPNFRTALLALAAAAMSVAACGTKGGSKAGQTAEEEGQAVLFPFLRINVDTTMAIVSIRDNATEKRMPNKLFYGEADSAEVEQLSPQGSSPASVSCFIVETRGRRALFDTGNGKENGGVLLERMAAMGISPDSIDYIFITHLHADHTGGLTDGGKPVFGRAQLYVPAAEYAYWAARKDRGGKTVAAVDAYGDRVCRFAYSDPLPLGVKAMPAPGHTPGHTVYQAGRVLIMGDLFHALRLQIQDMKLCAAYDMDRAKAIGSREKFVAYARANGLMTAGMHFFDTGIVDYKVDDTPQADMPQEQP